MPAIPSFKLNTGASIPGIALGTWESAPEDVYGAVLEAIKVGYRHIDTAHVYGNEEPVGKAIRDSGVPREELFVTTKLWLDEFSDPELALDGSLKRLGLDYVDLYLIHWPFAITSDKKLDNSTDYIKTWAKVQELPTSKTRAVGVSNVSIANLEKLLAAESTKKVPATNQVELHIDLPQQKLVDYCHSKGIVVEAYSPLSRGNLDNEVIAKLAEKYNTHPANIVLSWGISRKTVILPKSVTPARIKSNYDYVPLAAEDIEAINKIADHTKLVRHCDFGETVGFDTFQNNADSK